MSVGRQLGLAVRTLCKLHNPPLRCRSTSLVVGPADLITDLALPPVRESFDNKTKTTTISKLHQNNASHPEDNTTVPSFEDRITDLLSKNSLKEVDVLLKSATKLSEEVLTKLFIVYSVKGYIDKVETLQRISKALDHNLHSSNGEYQHFLAKAHCMRGNSKEGLTMLTEAFTDNVQLRSQYISIFRELIFDSVDNKSVASLTVFQSFVVRWSEELREHYPLICLWHQCWQSSWYSDQMLSDELVDNHEVLRNIIKDRILAFVMASLVRNNDDDAILRLLQTLLKYKFMEAYEQALGALFQFRLRNHDMRGCAEILRNMKLLGLSLKQDLQEKYIHRVISEQFRIPEKNKPKTAADKFMFKF